ncbi:MAG: aspartate dehydrogenase [Blautia sp.]
MIFGKKQKNKNVTGMYDKENQIPVLRSSICTGEQVVGFQDKNTGKFLEEGLIASPDDLKRFLDKYGLKETDIKKVW